ncbi:MAG: translation elongation factor 4 [Candidatus Paceibacterota bacterium]|jgi:GTP-binding protein LepA|nr:translation elongation factor 4 [Candidatus Paceibacterota bacterium]
MINRQNIRNFSIIAHIDHGKSTLADRMLEITHTIEKRKMMAQVLDSMELERERGITIKMQPVRMEYQLNGEPYILNLIDTPGHIDFSYEVSRALKAVEGSILLVDATQGVQAQTLTTLEMARESGLTIIPVVSKIDSPIARTKEVKEEVAQLLDCNINEVLEVSGKTGEGVEAVLDAIIKKIQPPIVVVPEGGPRESIPRTALGDGESPRALVFDFEYSNHRGVIVYVRMFNGEIKKNDTLLFSAANEKFIVLEVGIFHPSQVAQETLSAGEIGYIVTGIKQPGIASVGDTVTSAKRPAPALPGYMNPAPVVWASVYPESQDDFNLLRQALSRLKLTDASLSYEEETSGTLGRGYRCGFLGMLHLEIITERLHREFNLELIIATPSITYEVEYLNGEKKIIYSPALFPDYGSYKSVAEPWVKAKIITPPNYVGNILTLLYEHEGEVGASEIFGENRNSIEVDMPLRELMRGFFDKLKSASSGYASLSYKITGMRLADVARLDIVVADEPVIAFTRVVSKKRVQEEAENAVIKLYDVLPRQLFVVKIQGQALGRILSSKTLSALRKDVTGYLYGGDITRKMKLLEKQKRGKKKMKARGRVNIPHEVFLKMMKQ